MEIKKIKGVIKEYDWGSTDFLPSLFGYEANGRPQAEAWFGTHPSGEAVLEDGTLLSDYIKKDSERYLGRITIERLGDRLPMLLKVLAIKTPLSIQCHPDRAQAKDGFAREASLREAGVPSKDRNYQDDNQKAEVLYALTPVTAMCGFRSWEDINYNLKRLIPVSYESYFESSKDISDLFYRLYTLDKKILTAVVEEYKANLAISEEDTTINGSYLTSRGIAERVLPLYGVDPGVLAPYLLNVIHLRPGEAVYLRPTVLHAYVQGNGVELMSLSDNVLRGGLTHKKVDVKELMSVMTAAPTKGEACRKSKDRFLREVIETPTDDFRLLVLKSGSYDINEAVPSLILCTDGAARVGTSNDHIDLKEGECCFVPSCDEEYHVRVNGKVFQAVVPEEL